MTSEICTEFEFLVGGLLGVIRRLLEAIKVTAILASKTKLNAAEGISYAKGEAILLDLVDGCPGKGTEERKGKNKKGFEQNNHLFQNPQYWRMPFHRFCEIFVSPRTGSV